MDLKLFESFSNDVEEATACYVIWNRLQNAPASDDVLLAAFNRTPLAWKVFRHTCVVALIAALGRIFDKNSKSASIDAVLTDFRGGTTARRKDRVALDIANVDIQQRRVVALRKIRQELKTVRRLLEASLLPLRHKLIAHREKEFLGKEDKLWAATARVNIEQVLDFLTDLQQALAPAYTRDHVPILGGRKIDKDWFETDINELLRTIRLAPAPPPEEPKIF